LLGELDAVVAGDVQARTVAKAIVELHPGPLRLHVTFPGRRCTRRGEIKRARLDRPPQCRDAPGVLF
jgi:hypothetical protein